MVGLTLMVAWSTAAAQSPELVTLAVDFDLDGSAADPDYVVESAELVDNKADYVIAADPDVCRPLDLTVVDANGSIAGGSLTVSGTDCLGELLVAQVTFDGAGDGVFPLSVMQGAASGPYFRTVAEVATNTLDGEGRGDSFSLGWSTDCPTQYLVYGTRARMRRDDAWMDTRTVDPFGTYTSRSRITTSGMVSHTLSAVRSDQPFAGLEVGDLLWLLVVGQNQMLRITSKRSDDQVDVEPPVSIPTDGIDFRWSRRFVSSDPRDGLWIPMSGYSAVSFLVDQDRESSTGDTITSIECRAGAASIETDSDTLDGETGALSTVDLARTRFEGCRIGLRFGMGDDDDQATAESIHVTLLGTVR